MVNIVIETYYSERNWQESALDTGIEEDTNDGMCWEASDEDTNTATYYLTSFNKRDIRANDGIARYTLSGNTKVEWEPEDDTQTEQSEYGKTNGITTPGSENTDGKLDEYSQTVVKEKTTETDQSASTSASRPTNELTTSDSDCAQVNLSNVFTSVKDKATEYMWRFFNARVDLLRNSMSYNETGKKKNITKQIVTRYTQKGNGILFGQCMIWTLLCIMPVAARPRPPRDDRMNLFSSEHMKLEDQKDMNVQGEDCRPQILAKTLPEDDFQQIKCETSTCTSKSRITFEKTSMHATQEWISVFEIYNKSNYHALNTNSEYSLENRALFNAFPTKHLLYIQPLRLDDRGMWRCVVHDTNNISYTSITSLKVDTLYVTPTDGNITIRRQKMEIVTGQATEFTCVVNGVFPKPEIIWKVNSVKSVKGISSSWMRDDKLWSVKNIVKLIFDKEGVNNVTCSIKTDKRNPWIQQKQSFDIKKAATIVFPKEDRVVLLQDNSMVNFECVGSGYRPTIHWTKDGEAIHDKDSRYELKRLCNESICIGYIKANYVDPVLGCAQIKAYTGVYSCVISLENPHHSTKMSPKYNVIMSDLTMCSQVSKNHDVHVGLIAAFIMISVVLVIVTMQLCIMILGRKPQVTRKNGLTNGQENDKMLEKGSDE